MGGSAQFRYEDWRLIEPALDLETLAQTESIFALSNGHIGLRGNLDEGEPAGTLGTYLNGLYENRPLDYGENAYGNPEQEQVVVNVADGKLIRLLVDDEPFDLRYGTVRHHERVLDLRGGLLTREAEWQSPAGKIIRVRSARLVSFTQRAVMAIAYEVTPLNEAAQLVIQSELVANEQPGDGSQDPRAAKALNAPFVNEFDSHNDLHAVLVHRTRQSGLRVAAAMDHTVEGPDGIRTTIDSDPDCARMTATGTVPAGETLRIVKLVAYGWSSERSPSALRDQVDGALVAAGSDWQELCSAQRAYLDEVWSCADIELDGDRELQLGVRFAAFQVIQASARAELRAIPAKGLTGSGYDGHTFWDTEAYTLRVLTYLDPGAARDALGWRHATMEMARERARELGLAGVTFPWRTIDGHECSGYWPAGTAAFHINADIADATLRYLNATEDHDCATGVGLELIVETARLWRSVGHHDPRGRFRIDGVTGPDEYTALCDNNVYTSLMAERNLLAAADLSERHPKHASALGVDDEEIAAWRSAAEGIEIPHDQELGITPQCDGFTRYRPWDFAATAPEDYPLLLHHHNYVLYSSQVVKQADLVFALYACGERFSPEQKARDFDFYEAITVRDSSLSAAIQAVVAAEVGHLDLAFDYLRESTLVDLRDLNGNTVDGLHLASMAGSWLAVVAGFGGMRDDDNRLSFTPRLPERLRSVSFGLQYRGRLLRVRIGGGVASYDVVSGDPLELWHDGKSFTVASGDPQKRKLGPLPELPVPSPPPGREPQGRA
jgi:alpha,alpha-trehalose phosphorylase